LILVDNPLIGVDLESALLGLGCSIRRAKPAELDAEWLRAAKESGIEAVLSVNHSPELSLLCTLTGLRYVSWTIDPLPSRRWSLLRGTDPDNCRLFVHRKLLVPPLVAMGYRHVEWLPLACPARRFEGVQFHPARSNAPLFVGSSLQDERRILTESLRKWGMASELPAMDSMLKAVAEAFLWDRSFPGFARQPEAVPQALRALLPPVALGELAEVLDAGATWHFRRELVRVLVARGTQVRGDDGWREIAGDRWKGPLRNGQEMTEAYAQAAVNLDVPRFHQREIATLRAFDAMGSGGVLACESGTELDELFQPGKHFLTWSDERGLREILEAAVARDAVFDRIGRAAHEAVVAHHSLESRARRILSMVSPASREPGTAAFRP